jgi:hypothetical protein
MNDFTPPTSAHNAEQASRRLLHKMLSTLHAVAAA